MTVVDGVNEDQRILLTILLPVQRVILNRMMVRDGFKIKDISFSYYLLITQSQGIKEQV